MPNQAESGTSRPDLLEVLALERLDADLFRSVAVFEDPFGLYGGQVAAQALRAAAETVGEGRHPNSLHGYFLSRGDPTTRVLLQVHRDRDGRSYSNRRVIAVQNGVVIFNLAASFHADEVGYDYQAPQLPQVTGPEELPDFAVHTRMLGFEIRKPEQEVPGQQWPSRVWLRSIEKLTDETLHACALTYVSDMFTGLSSVRGMANVGIVTSLDHTVWFYRKVAMDDWVLMDLRPESTAGGRGMYTGRIFSKNGELAAGIAQESLFRPGSKRPETVLAEYQAKLSAPNSNS
jgi:acyl-CoA thioesterase-2